MKYSLKINLHLSCSYSFSAADQAHTMVYFACAVFWFFFSSQSVGVVESHHMDLKLLTKCSATVGFYQGYKLHLWFCRHPINAMLSLNQNILHLGHDAASSSWLCQHVETQWLVQTWCLPCRDIKLLKQNTSLPSLPSYGVIQFKALAHNKSRGLLLNVTQHILCWTVCAAVHHMTLLVNMK